MARRNRARRIDPRRAKTHHSYTIAETAALFGVHRNTVRNWIRAGLRTLTAGGLVLILGSELRDFLTRTKARRRVRCGPGSMFCLKCRAPRTPPDGLVESVMAKGGTVNLRGLCPDCGTMMHRRANLSRLFETGFGHVSRDASASAPS
jgi:excisionase family DNA binding protein